MAEHWPRRVVVITNVAAGGCCSREADGACPDKSTAMRERKPSFGAMVQLDGSHHVGSRAGVNGVLMVMVERRDQPDRARFFEEETTRASYDVFEGGSNRDSG